MAKYPTNYPTVDENHYNYAPPQQAYLGNPSDAHIPQAKPVYVPPGQDKVGKWTASLFGCFGDCGVCCLGYFLPCVLYGQNVETLTGDGCCAPCCLYCLLSSVGFCACYACGTRERLRKKYSLPPSPCNDFCVHCFCWVCALCQEAREMKIQANRVRYATQPHVPPPQQVMRY